MQVCLLFWSDTETPSTLTPHSPASAARISTASSSASSSSSSSWPRMCWAARANRFTWQRLRIRSWNPQLQRVLPHLKNHYTWVRWCSESCPMWNLPPESCQIWGRWNRVSNTYVRFFNHVITSPVILSLFFSIGFPPFNFIPICFCSFNLFKASFLWFYFIIFVFFYVLCFFFSFYNHLYYLWKAKEISPRIHLSTTISEQEAPDFVL